MVDTTIGTAETAMTKNRMRNLEINNTTNNHNKTQVAAEVAAEVEAAETAVEDDRIKRSFSKEKKNAIRRNALRRRTRTSNPENLRRNPQAEEEAAAKRNRGQARHTRHKAITERQPFAATRAEVEPGRNVTTPPSSRGPHARHDIRPVVLRSLGLWSFSPREMEKVARKGTINKLPYRKTKKGTSGMETTLPNGVELRDLSVVT